MERPEPERIVRRVIDPATRVLRHTGLSQARQARRQAEFRASQAVENRKGLETKKLALIDRARGEDPPREELEGLRGEIRRALDMEAQRATELLAAREAETKAEVAAPSNEQLEAWRTEILDGLEERRRAVDLLTQTAFADRVHEIRNLLGEPMGLGSLVSELAHINRSMFTIRRSFYESNTISRGWWAEGPDDAE